MDPAAPAAAPRGLAPAQAPALAQINGQEVSGNERSLEKKKWAQEYSEPFLQLGKRQNSVLYHLMQEAAGGATAAGATKAEFHHPVRLFWPKSRSFDYLYSAGEVLLQNFPVQATINLYEDSDSEEEEDKEEDEEEEEEEEEEVNEIGPEGCARVPEATPHKATAHSPDQPLTCPN